MKHIIFFILSLNAFYGIQSQGITLLYKGTGGVWDNPLAWTQINTPIGQTPIHRVPTELDDIVFNSKQSGLTNVYFDFTQRSIDIGGNGTTGFRCRSMHISNTRVVFNDSKDLTQYSIVLNVYTANGGFVLIDSGAIVPRGHFRLHGGNPAIKDLEIVNSDFGELFSHNDWSSILLDPNGKARFVNSKLAGHQFGIKSGSSQDGKLYAENCTFLTNSFKMGDSSTATILNTKFTNDWNNNSISFIIGRNANFVSSNVNIESMSGLSFCTSGSVLHGNISTNQDGAGITFAQQDPANPLPNIIDGNLAFSGGINISGDLKISGDLINKADPRLFYPDTSHVFINGQDILTIGGVGNYRNSVSITNCVPSYTRYCNFKLEFFGSNNSNILWPFGFPIDTLIVNKSGCAKLTATNSLYVSGEARVQNGQLVLDPNDNIPYKFVCAGNLNIYQGGGVLLRKNATGVVANIAVDGYIKDYNTTIDSTCTGFSNPYIGNVTLYRTIQSGGNNFINIISNGNIGNLNLIGQNGSDFKLAGNLAVNNFSFVNSGKLLLENHNLEINGKISNYGNANYFVTNGSGKLQINKIGNVQTVFPVGPTTSSYNPVGLVNYGTVDNFRINVQPQVLFDGNSGAAFTNVVVSRTWNIEELTPGGSNAALNLQWNANDELPGFTRGSSYLSHYTSNAWDNGGMMAAIGSGPYSLARNNITSFSPFAVMNQFSVVPVALFDFSGRYQNKAIDLKWTTEREVDVKYYEVERSRDQSLFEPIKRVDANANSQVKKEYLFEDKTASNGVNYYRLKIVDLNGTIKFSQVIAVLVPYYDNAFVVYPNPVKDILFIRFHDLKKDIKISIVDAKGTNVKQISLKGTNALSTTINVQDLPAGVYHVSINSMETLQFIKQ